MLLCVLYSFSYFRLALDLDQHLKKPKIALEKIKAALDDPSVQEARLLSLQQRVERIVKSKKNGITLEEKRSFENHARWLCPQEPEKEVIQGKMMPKSNLKGESTVFLIEGKTEEDDDHLCSVEEFVKNYYITKKGYTNGMHAEGSVVNTICTILVRYCIFKKRKIIGIGDLNRSQFSCSSGTSFTIWTFPMHLVS